MTSAPHLRLVEAPKEEPKQVEPQALPPTAGESLFGMAKQTVTQHTIETLVQRARLGDQNASGMLAAVKQSAEKGSPKAKEAALAILEYIKKNPNGDARIAGENLPSPIAVAGTRIAQGPVVSKEAVQSLVASLEPDQKKAVAYGFKLWRDAKEISDASAQYPAIADDIITGASIGYGIAAQRVTRPNSRLSDFCHVVGFEHGE